MSGGPWPASDGSSVWWSWSEPRRDREEDGPLRRIRTEVDVPDDGLLAVVRHFGIVPEVVREQQQVTPGDAHPRRAGTDPTRPSLRQLERNARLAQLEEGRGLDERARRPVDVAGVE